MSATEPQNANPATMANPADQPMPDELRALWPSILEDAARRSGLPAAALRVASVQAVVWPDSSLGCPRSGLAYMQVLVPGHRVRIATPDGALLDYHLNARGRWLHCPAAQAQKPLPGGANPRI